MSKIAKAVERAKRSREARFGIPEGPKTPFSTTGAGLSAQVPGYSDKRVIVPERHYLEAHRILTMLDDSLAIDTYNILCTQLLLKTRPNLTNAIMVTSCVEDEGKTLTAINLAVSIARRVQHTVLLVDVDLRKPSIHRYLGLDIDKGLAEHLSDNVPLAELLVSPGLPRMSVLAAVKPVPGATEILGSPRMEQLVQELKNRYPDRYVIFDTPPVLSVSDSFALSSFMDGILLVVEAGRTPRDEIRKAVELFQGKPLLGLIMNKCRYGSRKYYYQ